LEYEEKARQEQVNFANQLISDETEKLANDSAKTYLAIQDRIHKTYEMMDKFDQEIQKKLADQKTDVYQEFNSTRRMEEIFLEKEGADKKEDNDENRFICSLLFPRLFPRLSSILENNGVVSPFPRSPLIANGRILSFL
jgi:hypothetical protein